ncbi:extensin family protein [Xanthobacter autotrophicus DSM 597]|uniref:extensin-like domain-containing protein n=1 Tax=Xanthobacter wiegelii TaxID=3119913 RepID=UPI003729560C
MSRDTPRIFLALLLLAGALSGCRFGLEERDSWRSQAEEQCLAAKAVVASAYMEPVPAVQGPGACGMDHPFRVSALAQGNVMLEPAGRLACPVIYQVDMWVQEVVQPAALAWLGQPIVAISQMSAYSCRGMNGDPNAKISEHAFGNALDIGGFRTADGRWITVKNGWKGSSEERGFLLQVQAGACERFTTVLAPGSNMFHYDHIHVDLMRHAKGRTICKPAPRPMPAPTMPTKAPPMVSTMEPVAPAPSVAEAPPVYAPPAQQVSAPAEQPSFFSTLFGGPRPAQQPQPEPVAAEPPPPLPPLQSMRPPETQIIASPAPAPAGYPAPSYPSPSYPPSNYPPASVGHAPPPAAARAAPPPSAPPSQTKGAPQGLPPGWQVGPQGVPMSYSSNSNPETGSIKRKYYTAPIPQPSTIPLPKAKAGED